MSLVGVVCVHRDNALWISKTSQLITTIKACLCHIRACAYVRAYSSSLALEDQVLFH
jgi:hypothetical protein